MVHLNTRKRRTPCRGGTVGPTASGIAGTNVTALMSMRRLAEQYGIQIPVEMEHSIMKLKRSPTRKNWRRVYRKMTHRMNKDDVYGNLLRTSAAFREATYRHPSSQARRYYKEKYGLRLEDEEGNFY